jgi:hypothetical protein
MYLYINVLLFQSHVSRPPSRPCPKRPPMGSFWLRRHCDHCRCVELGRQKRPWSRSHMYWLILNYPLNYHCWPLLNEASIARKFECLLSFWPRGVACKRRLHLHRSRHACSLSAWVGFSSARPQEYLTMTDIFLFLSISTTNVLKNPFYYVTIT